MKHNRGTLYAAVAYSAWGLLPIYWKALHTVPALEVLANRIVWSLGVALLLAAWRGSWAVLRGSLRDRRTLAVFAGSGLLLAANWLVYIWAVQAGFVLESSLGYFINPLVNVLLGVVFLRERLRAGQVAAVLVAAGGVLYLTFAHGGLPWIALVLAATFGGYGLLRKTAALGSLEGLTLETAMMAVPALALLVALAATGRGALTHSDLPTTLLLVGTGAITSVPLVLFAAGARRITMVSLGILQYITPTLQFLLGTLLYGEAVSPERLAGFALIWVALVIYTVESIAHGRGASVRRAAAGA